MDTKTWIAVAAGFAAVGLAPAYASDAQQESTAINASEKAAEKDKKDASNEADARAEKARKESGQTSEQETTEKENTRRARPINPNAI